MDKIKVMRLVKESKLNKYEKLFLLDFIMSESDESIALVLNEFNFRDIAKHIKSFKHTAQGVVYHPKVLTALFKMGSANIAGGDLAGPAANAIGKPALAYAKSKFKKH